MPLDGQEYVICTDCGEYHDAALRLIDGRVVCFNCTSPGKHRRGLCACCMRDDMPLEKHHVATRSKARGWVLSVCLNCHAVLSVRQRHWHPQWSRYADMTACLERGFQDVAQVYQERRKEDSALVVSLCQSVFQHTNRAQYHMRRFNVEVLS